MRRLVLAIFCFVASGTPVLAHAVPSQILARDLLVRESTPALVYEWRVPPDVAAQPQLLARLRSEARTTLTKMRRDAASEQGERAKDKVPPRAYVHRETWTLTHDGPALIAMLAETYDDTGGAHGNTGHCTVYWDKRAQRTTTLAALFTDRSRAMARIAAEVCKQLNADPRRADRKAGECPPIAQPAVALSDGDDITCLMATYSPYIAGPYSDGIFRIEASLPDAARVLVKSAFRRDLLPSGYR